MAVKVEAETCIRCGICIDECKPAAIFFSDDTAEIIEEDCTDCGHCVKICVIGAITPD
jgi:ferredoxin